MEFLDVKKRFPLDYGQSPYSIGFVTTSGDLHNSSASGSLDACGEGWSSHTATAPVSRDLYALPDNDFTRSELAKMPLRFQSKVRVEWNGCWIWTAHKHKGTGYSEIKLSGYNRKTTGHRFAYMTLIGPIPEGLECDHMCGQRACVNPYHIQLVSHAQNIRKYSARVRSLLGKALDGVVESLSGRRVPKSRVRTLSDVVALWNTARRSGDGVSLGLNSPSLYREIPYMVLLHKTCKDCGQSKTLRSYYTIKNWAAWPRYQLSYKSSSCKPCHNVRTSANRRARKAERASK